MVKQNLQGYCCSLETGPETFSLVDVRLLLTCVCILRWYLLMCVSMRSSMFSFFVMLHAEISVCELPSMNKAPQFTYVMILEWQVHEKPRGHI